MLKYAKIIDEETKEVQIGVGVNDEYYASIGMTEMEVEQAYTGLWYLKGYAPIKPEPTIQDRILELESKITARNLRSAIFGDEYAIEKIRAIEAEIEELRKQLEA
jgi:hypothetical protein